MSMAVPYSPEPQNTLRRRQGWSLRRTGKSLGVSHVTVSRYPEQTHMGESTPVAPA